MNRHTMTCFDEYISGTNSATVTTSLEHAGTLGIFDQIAMQLTAVEGSGSNPQIQCAIWHSSEGGNLWLAKNPGTPEIPFHTISANAPNPLLGFDDGSAPNLQYVRFQIDVTAMGVFNVRVKLDVTLNDSRESQFAAKMRALMKKADHQNKCTLVIQGGSPVDASDPRGWGAQLLAMAGRPYVHPDGPFGIFKNPVHPKWILNDDVSVCVMRDGSIIVSEHGHHSVELQPRKDGSSGSGGCG